MEKLPGQKGPVLSIPSFQSPSLPQLFWLRYYYLHLNISSSVIQKEGANVTILWGFGIFQYLDFPGSKEKTTSDL